LALAAAVVDDEPDVAECASEAAGSARAATAAVRAMSLRFMMFSLRSVVRDDPADRTMHGRPERILRT
jgi:hypothetical protein